MIIRKIAWAMMAFGCLTTVQAAEKITSPVFLLFACSIADYCFFTSDSCPKR